MPGSLLDHFAALKVGSGEIRLAQNRRNQYGAFEVPPP
jgi:hypothetical protein